MLFRSGRDQQDQRLELMFNRELCVWDLIKIDTELWKEPTDPLLEAIAFLVSNEEPEWKGTASQLLEVLPEINLQPNILTRKLNISSEHLLLDFNIKYSSVRGHEGRMIVLKLLI